MRVKELLTYDSSVCCAQTCRHTQ